MSRPWMKWYPKDWRADARLRMCSLGARGLWIELIGYMHEAEPYGHLTINDVAPSLEDIAALVGRPIGEVRKAMAELRKRQVFSEEANSAIYSRRMVRDKAKEELDTTNGKSGGHPDIRRGTVAKEDRVRRFRRSDAPEKARRIFDRSGGACHWCRTKLDDGTYHIDHVKAVRDGGTNDENNLVAACPDCNGERAMVWGRNDTALKVGNDSDHKAQIPEAREPEKKDAADAAPALERQLFDRGKSVLGATAGGLIAKLLKAKGGDIALARAAIETASTKQSPREYISAIIAHRGAGEPSAGPLI